MAAKRGRGFLPLGTPQIGLGLDAGDVAALDQIPRLSDAVEMLATADVTVADALPLVADAFTMVVSTPTTPRIRISYLVLETPDAPPAGITGTGTDTLPALADLITAEHFPWTLSGADGLPVPADAATLEFVAASLAITTDSFPVPGDAAVVAFSEPEIPTDVNSQISFFPQLAPSTVTDRLQTE